MKTVTVVLKYDDQMAEDIQSKLEEMVKNSGFHLAAFETETENISQGTNPDKNQSIEHVEPLRKFDNKKAEPDVGSSGSGGMVSPN